MNIEQIYTGCLAQGAYFIESQGEVETEWQQTTQPQVECG